MSDQKPQDLSNAIAVIGMSGRWPGARNVAEFWRNQLAGIESVSRFRVDELEVANAAEAVKNPAYVSARPIVSDVDQFDAAFFGLYPKEAELMDPQHRLFLEICWEALEDAGCDPMNTPGMTGVYAGCSTSTYFLNHVCRDRRFIEDYVAGYQVENYPVLLGSNVDFLATRVAYKLNLKGPAFTMVAGCASSLLAISQAALSLQTYQCDMALAGGVSVTFPQKRGYLYQDGGMASPDGHCRAFDENANGTVFGGGAAVVLLKRYRRRGCRWRPDLCRDPRIRRQQRRLKQGGLYGAERRGASSGSRHGAGGRGSFARHRWLHRGAWHGNAFGRSHRDRCSHPGISRPHKGEAVLCRRDGQDECWTFGYRSRRHGIHSCRARGSPRNLSGNPALQAAKSETGTGEQPVLCECQPQGVAAEKWTAPSRRERIWRGWQQRARGSGAGAGTVAGGFQAGDAVIGALGTVGGGS